MQLNSINEINNKNKSCIYVLFPLQVSKGEKMHQIHRRNKFFEEGGQEEVSM
jgi:hypothetical protein